MYRLNERLQSGLQRVLASLRQINKSERLEPPLRSPHGKHDLCFFVDGGFPELEDYLDFEFFVERLLYVHQAAGGRKLMEFAPHLTTVRKSHERQDGAPELDSKRALPLLAGGG
jgi:hypothetical protein